MIEIKNKANCNGCHACYQICPVNAIEMKTDSEGFWYPKVDSSKCIKCKQCIKVCPEINPSNLSAESVLYACYRVDLEKRMKSASGGIFALLAEKIIDEGGLVFGAKFDEQFKLSHSCADSKQELVKLQGSKYVQSKIGNTFSEAKKALTQGRKVLFSGTPCQIQGLKNYLNKDYENLITVDLVCHGVPSPLVWEKYKKEISGNNKITEFIPRDKSNGIKDAPLVFKFNDGSVINEKYSDNIYIKGFIKNLYLRPSCYDCSFKGIERCSDITIGDFWGLEKYHPEFCNEYGISLAILHTDKGKKYFSKISNALISINSTVEEAVAENPCILSSVPVNKKRDEFFNQFEKTGMIKTTKKLTKSNLKNKIHSKINIFLSKIIKFKNIVFK